MGLLAALAALTLCASAAHAQIQCTPWTHASAPTDWSDTLTVATFDPSLGQLTMVRLTLVAEATGSCATENLGTDPSTVTFQFSASLSVSRGGVVLVAADPTAMFVDSLSAYDGTLDFGGTSGVTHSGIVATATASANLTEIEQLAQFQGAGASTVLDISAFGMNIFTGPGGGLSQFLQQASATLDVCYEYVPFVHVACAGDGSGSACPCGNDSAPFEGRGCRNSTGQGAALRASGSPSLASDTLILRASDLTGTTALFFQGTSLASGGAGVVFGDGLRCASGTVVRLGIEPASSGVASFPAAGDPPISVQGSVASPGTRHYQTWYRNAASFCTSSTFNLTNALSVDWQS